MVLPLETVAIALYISLVTSDGGAPIQPPWVWWAGPLVLVLLCGLLYGVSRFFALAVLRQRQPVEKRQRAKLLLLLQTVYLMLVSGSAILFYEFTMILRYGWPMWLKAGLAVLAYVLLAFCWWIPQLPVHRRMMPGQWSMGAYLLHKVRYRMYLLLLWLPLLVAEEYLAQNWQYGLAILPFLAVMIFPSVMRRFWGCRKVGDEMAGHLQALAREAGVRVGGFYYWDIGGGVVNAAAVGLFYPFCFVFLSRSLVEVFTADEMRAVIGHELGHLKRRHLLFHFLYLAAFFSVLETFATYTGLSAVGQVAILVAGAAVYIRLVFGAVSRAFERQADVFGAELCGTEAMCGALERIASMYGGTRSAPSWHHYSVAQRTSFLHLARHNPKLVQKVNHQAAVFMAGGVACGAIVVLLIAFYGMIL